MRLAAPRRDGEPVNAEVDWYNNPRLHRLLGNDPPVEYEQAHWAALNPEARPT